MTDPVELAVGPRPKNANVQRAQRSKLFQVEIVVPYSYTLRAKDAYEAEEKAWKRFEGDTVDWVEAKLIKVDEVKE